MKSKGYFPHSLLILAGVIVVIFIFIITMKFLGMWASFQYETEAEKSAKNMQTAMNYVCASPEGASTTVKINLPQKITTRGAEANPISLLKNIVTNDIGAVSKAMKYMAAVDSYGDPWYVIYYEKFPQNEDSGWKGWSEVAAMRTTAMVFRGVEAASCALEIIPFGHVGSKILGALKKGSMGVGGLGWKGTKYVGKKILAKAGRESLEVIKHSRAVVKITNVIKSVKAYLKKGLDYEGWKLFNNEIGRKISTKIKSPLGDVWMWFKGVPIQKLNSHVTESAKVIKTLQVVSSLGDGFKMSQKTKLIKMNNKLNKWYDEILFKGVSNKKVRFFSKNVKKLSDEDLAVRKEGFKKLNIFSTDNEINSFYDEAADSLNTFKLSLDDPNYNWVFSDNLDVKDKEYLEFIVTKINNKEIPKTKEIERVEKIVGEVMKKCGDQCKHFEKSSKIIRDYTSMHRVGDNFNYKKILDDTRPFRWTRSMLGAEMEEPFLTGLPYLARMVKRGFQYRGGPTTIKWGVWRGFSFIFSDALDRAQIADLKFSPCSDHALCLKSQANPSITIYPLEECKQAGIDYIELEKYPLRKTSSGYERKEGILGLTRRVDAFFGASPYSRFYSASPCGGKLKIEKGKCKCNDFKKPYYDYTSQDVFFFVCNLTAVNQVDCEFARYENYTGETEELGTVTKTGSDIDVTPIPAANPKEYKVFVDFSEEIWGQGYKDFDKRVFNYTKYITGVGKSFLCEFSLPAIAFYTTECKGSYNWLECTYWNKTGTKLGELDSIEGTQKINITEWCCLQWNLTAYGGPADGKTAKIINVSECENYDWGAPLVEGESEKEIKKNLSTTLHEGSPPGSEWNISNPDSYYNSIKEDVVDAIKDYSKIELRKGQDPNKQSINELYSYNLQPEDEIDCLKVSFITEDVEGEYVTDGFCYSSPPQGEALEELKWTAGSILLEVGVNALGSVACGLAIETGPGAIACAKGTAVAACEIGTAISWYGQNQVAENRQERLWPNNPSFGDYFIE